MALISALFFFMLAAFHADGAVTVRAQQKPSNSISLGSSLSPNSRTTSWRSPSGQFAFGFYPYGRGFLVGIWLVGNSRDLDTVVWTAFRNDPPVSSNATLDFTHDGKLVLRIEVNQEKIIADASPSSYALMLDSGNFVLHHKNSSVVWQSFDFPTNTILAGQSMYAGEILYSNSSITNSSTGRFCLKMQGDGNLVLYPVNTSEVGDDASWASGTFGANRHYHLYLNETSNLVIVNNTNSAQVTVIANDSSRPFAGTTRIIYRATLDVDGVFRLYSHSYDSTSGQTKVSIVWSALHGSQCQVKGVCGFNSFCTVIDNEPSCFCIPGTDFVDPNQRFAGCEKLFLEGQCRDGKEMNTTLYNMSAVENLDWDEPPYFKAPMPKEDCSRSCLEDCDCDVALFKEPNCMKQKFPLKYVTRKSDVQESLLTFFKVGDVGGAKRGSSARVRPPPQVLVVTSKKAETLIILISLGFTACACVALAISGVLISKFPVISYRRLLDDNNSSFSEMLTLQPFPYSKLKKATGDFKEELGRGSFGRVYKGTLCGGKKIVAVKRLEKMVEKGEREFLAEMRAIGRAHHRNLVRLLGYCTENSQRLLVYEYMSNGSLADILFKNTVPLPEWNERERIALDIARGILYLHEECEAPIIHCDIKPQNILMDAFWTAKITDFGLAKLLVWDQTRTFTMVKGTRGYMAPELQKNVPISVKADIYSYGVLLLEIICCRRNMEINLSKQEVMVLSTWVYQCLVANEVQKVVGDEEVDRKALERMVLAGLWCIQEEPALRPSIKSIVLMLEGNITDISIPPCPSSTSI